MPDRDTAAIIALPANAGQVRAGKHSPRNSGDEKFRECG